LLVAQTGLVQRAQDLAVALLGAQVVAVELPQLLAQQLQRHTQALNLPAQRRQPCAQRLMLALPRGVEPARLIRQRGLRRRRSIVSKLFERKQRVRGGAAGREQTHLPTPIHLQCIQILTPEPPLQRMWGYLSMCCITVAAKIWLSNMQHRA
jgi:hypothetical protein